MLVFNLNNLDVNVLKKGYPMYKNIIVLFILNTMYSHRKHNVGIDVSIENLKKCLF